MTDLTKYDPEQVMEKMVHMRAESGGHYGRTVRLNDGKIPLATCPAQLFAKQ